MHDNRDRRFMESMVYNLRAIVSIPVDQVQCLRQDQCSGIPGIRYLDQGSQKVASWPMNVERK